MKKIILLALNYGRIFDNFYNYSNSFYRWFSLRLQAR